MPTGWSCWASRASPATKGAAREVPVDPEQLAVHARPLRVRDCYPKKADFEPGLAATRHARGGIPLSEVQVMTQPAKEVLTEALRLPPSERGELAARLIESLDPAADEDVEAAWNVEIQGRLEELETGQVQP